MVRKLAPLALSAALALAPFSPARAQDATALEQALVESATTPQQHSALARYYEAKAADARKQADEHKAMGKSYGGTKFPEAVAMREHCEKLASLYGEQAAQYDLLAKQHAAMAK